jgi:Dolichyl-phosphate-mannose-protein mannosyltransferase
VLKESEAGAMTKEPGRRHRITEQAFAFVMLLGIVVRFWGIGHDLPFIYDPDEPTFVGGALRMLHEHSLNPGWFGHPASTTMDLLAATYTAIYAAGRLAGRFHGPVDFRNLYHSDPTVFYLSGRILSAVFGVAMIWLVFQIGRRVFSARVGLLSAFVVAICPLLVASSQNVRTDVQMSTLVLIAFWFSLDVLERGDAKAYLLAGLFTGLATVTKFPAVTVALVVFAAHLMRRPKGAREHLKLGASAASSVLGAFAVAPFLFLRFPQALADVAQEARPSHLSHTGHGLWSNFAWYWTEVLPTALTVPGALLAIAGIVICLSDARRDRKLTALYPILFLFFISALSFRWARWAVLSIPFLAITLSVPIVSLLPAGARSPRKAIGRLLLGAALAAWIVGSLGFRSMLDGMERASESTQTVARNWAIANIPKGSRLVLERYCPQFPKDMFTLFIVDEVNLVQFSQGDEHSRNSRPPGGNIGKLKRLRSLEGQAVQYMVLSDWYDRFVREGSEQQDIVATYEQLMHAGRLLYEVKAERGKRSGPPIRIYQFDSGALHSVASGASPHR